MVVSGESISNLGDTAAEEIRSILSKQLASLTVGDAGAAVIVERAEPEQSTIELAGFTTLSEHSRLCIGMPSRVRPGAMMLTDARAIHRAAIDDAPGLLAEVIERTGIDFRDIDWVIPHQTSARAIEKGTREISERLGVTLKNVVENVAYNGNTASTTHFVALRQYLEQRRFRESDRILLIAFASGLEVGVTLFTVGDLVGRYGRAD
jgi:3-oxoacyl-[acyl-carrier-protein] synthase-3